MSELSDDVTKFYKPNWVWISTRDTIDNEVPSVTAILETLIAVPLYWSIALKTGVLWPLAISVAVAPLVLLRSPESIKRGARWFSAWEKRLATDKRAFTSLRPMEQVLFTVILALSVSGFPLYYYIISFELGTNADVLRTFILKFVTGFFSVTFPLAAAAAITVALVSARTAVLSGTLAGVSGGCAALLLALHSPIVPALAIIMGIVVSAALSVQATRFLIDFPKYFGIGFSVVITSLAVRLAATARHIPEGIANLPGNFRRLTMCTSPTQIPELVPGLDANETEFILEKKWKEFINLWKKSSLFEIFFATLIQGPAILLWFFPGWVYRLTIKSTAWFWWPLAFFGGNLDRAKNPELFHWKVMGSLWAKASVGAAVLSLIMFLLANLGWKILFEPSPLLTPLGYLLRMDGQVWPWQVCAVLGSGLSIVVVFLVNDASGEYRIAIRSGDVSSKQTAERKFAWIELLAWSRSIVFGLFLMMVAAHGVLYFNADRCWFLISSGLKNDLETIYGDRLPTNDCDKVCWADTLHPLTVLQAR